MQLKHGQRRDFALETVAEYVLWMQGRRDDTIVDPTPPLMVDKVWHEHLLHTKAYATFCQEHLGGFVHHYPDLTYQVMETGCCCQDTD